MKVKLNYFPKVQEGLIKYNWVANPELEIEIRRILINQGFIKHAVWERLSVYKLCYITCTREEWRQVLEACKNIK